MMSGSAKRLYRNGWTSSKVSGPPRLRRRTPTTSSFSSIRPASHPVIDGSETARAATRSRRPGFVPTRLEPREPFDSEEEDFAARCAPPARAPDPATRVAATRLDDVPTTPRSPLIIAEDAPIAALTASAIAHSLCLPRFMRDSSGIDVSSHKKRLGPWRLLEPLRSRPSWVWIERGPCCAPRVPIEETRGPNPARAFARVARDCGGGPRLREALSLYVILNHVKTPIQSSSGRIGNQIPVCVKL